MAADTSDAGNETPVSAAPADEEGVQILEEGTLCVPYIPDFRIADLLLFFAPDLENATEVYHSLPPSALDRWSSYFTKKGWNFIQGRGREAAGPFRVEPGRFGIEIVESGRFFLPRPQFRLHADSKPIPIISLEKRRPFDPWKPNYIRAVNFIKKYEPVRPMSRAIEFAIWEVEECGEVSGSTSWENAEILLSDFAGESDDLRALLSDIFEKRPEDFPLGSEVYLRILGRAGDSGFQRLCELHRHPQRLKRCHVARALGNLGRPEGLETLLGLLEDEDQDVRNAALCAIGKVGTPGGSPAEETIRPFLEAEEVEHRVWAAEALLRGGDAGQEKFLVQMVKETPLPLFNMGELGEILRDLKVYQAVPFLINRLKSERLELRDDAAEALRGLTGLNLEFYGDGDPEERRQAVRQWKNWWEDHKRTRRK